MDVNVKVLKLISSKLVRRIRVWQRECDFEKTIAKMIENVFRDPREPVNVTEDILTFFIIFIVFSVLCFILKLLCCNPREIKKAARVSARKECVEKIDNFVSSVADITIVQKLKLLSKVLQKVPQRYFDEERLGKYYIPELLSLLEAYCNLSEKDDAAKANILESIEVVTGVSKSILGDLDENEKMKLEINSNVLSQMAKMDGYKGD